MTDNRIDVFYHNRLVGTLAMAKDRRIAFQYSREWLSQGFSLNPFSLPLTDKVFLPKFTPFDGLFGVFTTNAVKPLASARPLKKSLCHTIN